MFKIKNKETKEEFVVFERNFDYYLAGNTKTGELIYICQEKIVKDYIYVGGKNGRRNKRK